jgi:hypothetical protein
MGGGTWAEAFQRAEAEWQQALRAYDDVSIELEKVEQERMERFKRNFEERKIAIEKFQGAYDKAAISIARRKELDGGNVLVANTEDLTRQTKISNDLILGGSNAATKLQLLGPTLQSETKKQTAILERIAANTEKTADNTEDSVGDKAEVYDR